MNRQRYQRIDRALARSAATLQAKGESDQAAELVQARRDLRALIQEGDFWETFAMNEQDD